MYLIDTYQLTPEELKLIRDIAKQATLIERAKGALRSTTSTQAEAEDARRARVTFFCERIRPTILAYIRAREDRRKFSVAEDYGGLTVVKSFPERRPIELQYFYGTDFPVYVRKNSSTGISSCESLKIDASVHDIITLFEILMEERELPPG